MIYVVVYLYLAGALSQYLTGLVMFPARPIYAALRVVFWPLFPVVHLVTALWDAYENR